MAKSEYIGINNVARKVKGIYVGVNGVARKVTKGYIGVGGVARQFYPGVVYNTWKKYNIIGATFSKVQLSQYKMGQDTTTISVDNTVQDPIPFSCTSASPASLYIQDDSYTVSSATLEKGATTSHISGYRRWSDKDYHNDKLVALKFAMTDLFPRDSRRSVYHYIFPGFVPVDDYLYYYHQYNGSLHMLGTRFVPNIDSITLARYKYTEDNDGDWDDSIYYYTLSSASAVSTIVAPQGTYPDCGVHSDGCIYIKQ